MDRFPKERVHEFQQELFRDHVEVFISTQVAEQLLVHRANPVFHNPPMAARVWGTVVVAFEISKDGNVLHPMAMSGPRMLIAPVLDAVRKYQFSPYLLNGKPIAVATHIAVTISNE